jgi:hypothetical protein
VLRQYPDAGARDTVGYILEAVERLKGTSDQADDTTVVVVRFVGSTQNAIAEDRAADLTLSRQSRNVLFPAK